MARRTRLKKRSGRPKGKKRPRGWHRAANSKGVKETSAWLLRNP